MTGNNGATFGPALICDAAFGRIIFSIPFNPILLVIVVVVVLCLYLIYLCLEQFFSVFSISFSISACPIRRNSLVSKTCLCIDLRTR